MSISGASWCGLLGGQDGRDYCPVHELALPAPGAAQKLIIRILLSRVLYSGPLFSETPIYISTVFCYKASFYVPRRSFPQVLKTEQSPNKRGALGLLRTFQAGFGCSICSYFKRKKNG